MSEEFVAAIAEALEKEQSSMQMTDRFKEYEEWDSLAVLSVMATIEERFGVVLSRRDLDQNATMQELFDHVRNQGK